jgi:probable F420-dependent oxidoreductase
MVRPLRIGHQLRSADPVADARRAEELGFDTVLVPDHVGPGSSPLPTLAAIAVATERVRLGTLVLNNDMRNPVQLAWDVSTIDRLSGGRVELGLGAGHTPQEYEATGIDRSAPIDRKRRLAESVEIVRRLLDGDRVDHDGEHYRITGAHVDRSVQDRLPILVGGNGAALLGHAGAHADIIGLQGLGRTGEDGHSHAAKWTADHLDAQIAQVRAGAGARFDALELNALVQVVQITDDRDAALAAVCERVDGLSFSDAAVVPYLLIGNPDEIVDHLHACNERWGISYFAVRDLDGFEPVLRALDR